MPNLKLNDWPKIDKRKNHMSKVFYGNAIDYLRYAILCTRPNISLLLEWLLVSKATCDAH